MSGIITVTRNGAGRHVTWCTACEDGYQGGKVAGMNWARKHVATERHVFNMKYISRKETDHNES